MRMKKLKMKSSKCLNEFIYKVIASFLILKMNKKKVVSSILYGCQTH